MKVVANRYFTLITQYESCRHIFASTKAVTEADIERLKGNVKIFMATARQVVVDRTRGHLTPKIHLLETHVVESVAHFLVGLGLLSEHGAESIYAEFNELVRPFDSVATALDRLKTVVRNHCISTLPLHLAKVPKVSRRESDKGNK